MSEFGLNLFSPSLLKRLEQLSTLPLPPLLKRNLVPFHRDLDTILQLAETHRPFYIYTGRGPSSASMHLGHLIPFLLTQYLQQSLNAHVVIQITDDEKYLFRGCSLEEVERNAQENIKDILACGFDPDKTFVFQNTHYIRELYPNVLRIQSHITNSQCFSTFGIKPESNIGQTAFCAIQAAPAMASSFPHLFGHQGTDMDQIHCLIPCGVDQDPYFRLTRDVLPKLGYPKPALICSGFLPALGGVNEKMSSTVPSSAIFLTDTDQQITAKLKKSFSGGRVDKEDHLKHGANLEVDVAYQYLRYFLDDDEELDRITKYYGPDPNYTPKLLSSQVKKHATEVVIALITQHRNKRI